MPQAVGYEGDSEARYHYALCLLHGHGAPGDDLLLLLLHPVRGHPPCVIIIVSSGDFVDGMSPCVSQHRGKRPRPS